MSDIAIKVENVSKLYRLGQIGTGSFRNDLKRFWATFRGKEDPFQKLGVENDRSLKTESDWVWALKNIDFDVKKGDVVGIIGKNGAGKSTLLKILSQITAPTTGKVTLNGKIASLLEVGTGFHPELSGRDNIFLNGSILGMRKHEIVKKFDEIVEFSGVQKYLDTPVKRYSSGMYVRLAFAVAAHLEPDILILDEVLAVGDADFQKKCLGKINSISKSDGRTVLIVSHNLATISNLCKKSILLQNGNVSLIDETSKVLDKYISIGQKINAEISGNNIQYEKECDVAYFNKLRVVSNTEITNMVNIANDIYIEAEFTITKDDVQICPSFHLLDSMGTCILASFNANSATLNKDPLYGEFLKVGSYKTSMIIPKNFLNESVYRINAFLVNMNNSQMAQVSDALEFTVIESGEMRKEFTGKWLGIIRPKLEWNTIKII
jgi:lipopolysaccharide transport system ATP-binding protein